MQPVSYSISRPFVRIVVATRVFAISRVCSLILIQTPLLSLFFRRYNPADSGLPMTCTCQVMYTRVRVCVCNMHMLRLFARARAVGRARTPRARMLDAKSISSLHRVYVHTWTVNLVVKFGRVETPRPLISNRLAIASERDCTRIVQSGISLNSRAWEENHVEKIKKRTCCK